jgi:hypothetical protein
MATQEYKIETFFPSAEYIVENSYIYSWECDIFLQMKSGYHYEIEQKISRSDFKADFKKSAKHFQLANSKKTELTIPIGKHTPLLTQEQLEKFDYDISDLKGAKRRVWDGSGYGYEVWLHSAITRRKNNIPNRFFYITPKGLLDVKEIPKYAGLLEYNDGVIKQIKTAPWLHKNRLNYDKVLLDKYKWRYLNEREKANTLKIRLNQFNNIYESPEDKYYQSEIDF